MQASPGTNQATLVWDSVIGATYYNLYLAYDPAINRSNYNSLAGGERISGVSSPFIVGGLTNRVYFFAVSAVAGTAEGPSSPPAVVALWAPANAPRTNYYAVAAGVTNAGVAYASGGRAVYQTTNGGVS